MIARPLAALAALALAGLAAPGPAARAADAGAVAAEPAADAPTVSAHADRTEARVGDVITLTITAVGPRRTPVNLPRALDLGPFSELDDQNRAIEEQDVGGDKMQRRFVLRVAAYEPGELVLPPVEVTYLGPGGAVLTARTEPLPIAIKSLLANEPEPQLKENAPPVRVLERDLLLVYLAGGLAAVALGALGATLVRRRLRARAAVRPAPPPRPAHEIALEKLDRLGAAGFEGDLRPLYFQLSEVVREYLGARFGFESLELTTEELVGELRGRQVRGLVVGEVEGWLAACDLVKFAKLPPSQTEARGALEAAIRIVESTRPRPEPAVAEGAVSPPEAAHG